MVERVLPSASSKPLARLLRDRDVSAARAAGA
jgi:hypothetical protein